MLRPGTKVIVLLLDDWETGVVLKSDLYGVMYYLQIPGREDWWWPSFMVHPILEWK